MAALIIVLAPGEWAAVSRGGVVRRVVGSGVAWRLPVVERFDIGHDDARVVPISVRAVTRDEVPVLVLLEATVSVARPAMGMTYADPWPAAELATERALANSVASRSASELAHLTVDDSRSLRLAARAAVEGLGVEVHELVPVEVDLQVAAHGRG